MIEIEKGVPLPERRRGFYPFKAMDVGDCFAAPIEKAKSVQASAWYYSKHRGGMFTLRRYVGEGIVRCWRVA